MGSARTAWPRTRCCAPCVNTTLRAYAALPLRFTAPVTPGETVRFQFWDAGRGTFHLRASVDARNAVVLNNGIIELA